MTSSVSLSAYYRLESISKQGYLSITFDKYAIGRHLVSGVSKYSNYFRISIYGKGWKAASNQPFHILQIFLNKIVDKFLKKFIIFLDLYFYILSMEITKEELTKLYNSLSNKEVCKQLGISNQTLINYLRKNKIKMKGKGNRNKKAKIIIKK